MSILMVVSSWIQRVNVALIVWDAIQTTFPVRNPQHLVTPKRKAPTHRAPPVQEPGPYVVVTIRCQLRINVIRHGIGPTVHRKMAETVCIHCLLCVNLDVCLICWTLYFFIMITIKTQSSSMLLLYSLIN